MKIKFWKQCHFLNIFLVLKSVEIYNYPIHVTTHTLTNYDIMIMSEKIKN